MQSSTSCVSHENGSKKGNLESSNAGEEDKWSSVKGEGGGGCGTSVTQSSRRDFLRSIEPIVKALSRLRKRNTQWHRILHARHSSSWKSTATIVENLDNPIKTPLTIPAYPQVPVTVPPEELIRSVVPQTHLQGTPPPSPVFTIPTIPNLLPTTADTLRAYTTTTTAPHLTITITTTTTITAAATTPSIPSFAQNSTTSRTTTEDTVIIITTSRLGNFTRAITTASSSRKITQTSQTSSLLTSSATTGTIDQLATLVYGEVPIPTAYNTPPSPTPTSDVSGGGGGGGGGNSPVQPKMLGGILGGIAGLGLMLFFMLLFVKRRKKKLFLQAQDDAGYGGPLPSPNRSMVERSMSLLGSTGLVPRYHRPVDDLEPQEQGFVRIAGRKLPPVLGGPRPDYGSMRSAGEGSSYCREDDHSFGAVGAPGTPVSSYGAGRYSSPPPPPSPSARPGGGCSRLKERCNNNGDDEVGRNISQENPIRTPSRPPLYLRQLGLAGCDDVGRSLASRDGSKASRFTEDVT